MTIDDQIEQLKNRPSMRATPGLGWKAKQMKRMAVPLNTGISALRITELQRISCEL